MKILLTIPAFLWGLVVKIRNFYYRRLANQKYFDDTYIICIGNLAVGGTGKTPHSDFFIKLLNNYFKIAFLSKGYKRQSKGFLIVEKTENPYLFGDEPTLIKLKNPNIPVVVCEDRIEGIKKIKEQFYTEVIILDDAFQFKKLKPTISILLTEYNRLYTKDYFLPLGRLRDSAKEADFADIIIVTKCPENLSSEEQKKIIKNLKIKESQKVFFSAYEYKNIVKINNENYFINLEDLKDYDVLLVTGIANPKSLEQFLLKKVKSLEMLSFVDHKNYIQKDFKKIINKFSQIQSTKKIIITTEKDAIKIKQFIEDSTDFIYYIPIEVKLLNENEENIKNFFIKKIHNFFKKSYF